MNHKNEPKEQKYSGEHYEAVVPDTLDLAERARLAINGLGGIIDPDISHTMFFHIDYAKNTPAAVHTGADILCDPKISESLMLLRTMCGDSAYLEREKTQRKELISRVKDGLYWNYADEARPWRASYSPMYDYRNKGGKIEDLCPVYGAGRIIRLLSIMYEKNQDLYLEKKIRELVSGLERIAVYKDNYCYFPDGGYGEPFNYPASGWISTDEPMSETEGGEGAVTAFQAGSIYGLVKWYNLSNDKKALELARKLVNFCIKPKFWGGMISTESAMFKSSQPESSKDKVIVIPDPFGIAGAELGHWNSHFHTRAITLRAILEYGIATNNWRLKEFVRRGYEFTLTNGIARLGWICSRAEPFGSNFMEGCNLGDLLALAIRLSDAGMGDYWDDVDSIVRNQLVESQFIDSDRLKTISQLYDKKYSDERLKSQVAGIPSRVSTDNIIDRTLGCFGAWIKPTSIENPWSAGCCNGNASQGLYYAWEGIVRENGESAQVNLLMNRAAKSLDVDSYLPYQGKVIIHNKKARTISVRAPSWVNKNDISARINNRDVTYIRVGNYILFREVEPGDAITLEFPMYETEASYTAAYRTNEEQTYHCTFRGSTLVDISPRDTQPTSYPLYLREHMRKDEAPMKKTGRFVADETIHGW